MKKLKWLDETRNSCNKQISSWDKRISKVLSYEYSCCEICIAEEYDMGIGTLRNCMEYYLGIRPRFGL